MPRTLLAAVLLAMGLPAAAQTVPTAGTARDALFDARRSQLVVQRDAAFLTEADRAALAAMPKVADLRYYGSIAVAPDEGLQSETSTAAFNFHSLAEARGAALRGCEGRRRRGAACRIAADVVPRGYRPGRPFSLSQDATAALQGRGYARGGEHMATSASTGAWGLGSDPATAIAACEETGGRGDCALALRN